MTRLFLGRRRRGKTTLAVYMAAKLPRRLVFDPRQMIRRPGAVIVRTADDLALAVDALGDGEFTELVYSPVESLRTIAFPAFTAEVKRWMVERPNKELAVIIDELSFVTNRSGRLDDDFEWALKTCDTSKTHFFLTCHRPNDVPVDVRAIADYWCIFQVTQEHDLDVIRERCKAAAVATVADLRGSEFLMWDDTDGSAREYRAPDAWFVPLADGHAIEWADLATTAD